MTKTHLAIVASVLLAMAGACWLAWRNDRPSVAKERPAVNEPLAQSAAPARPPAKTRRAQLEREFARTLSGATLRGHLGRRQKREIEAVSPDTPYRLGNVTKLDDEGNWKLEYYIPGTDLLFDMPPVKVEWASDSPVITITDMQINGKKGTFRARILIDGDEYSGTWSDGKSKGCIFGTIVHDGAAQERET